MRILNKLNPTKFFIILAVLYLARIGLSYAGQAANDIESVPVWLSPTLTGLAHITRAAMVIVALALVLAYGDKIIAWLKSAFDFEADPDPDQGQPEQKQAEAITRDLSQAVISLDRHGAESGELIESVESQTSALVEIVKKLAIKSTDLASVAASFKFALEAIASKEPTKIALAAGKVKDRHIRNLMLLPYTEGNADYWASTSNLIATQLGNAERWQSEYSKMAVSLMAEVNQIKTGLTAAMAQIEAAETARPLLQAKVNLDQAGRYLRLPTGEQAKPNRLFAPQNEYAVLGKGGKR